ncbi:hypothetical protein Vafri_12907 [Volvox africanus]|uniref:Uncharacterized protein n=1 Tax=Volvox africanus TaxID=51714 RepID=A0A8J4BAF2_9CHLO|nr:hypothetical protein Vafri_12907 [Volvox africanus]
MPQRNTRGRSPREVTKTAFNQSSAVLVPPLASDAYTTHIQERCCSLTPTTASLSSHYALRHQVTPPERQTQHTTCVKARAFIYIHMYIILTRTPMHGNGTLNPWRYD